jgi:hypothetical protein
MTDLLQYLMSLNRKCFLLLVIIIKLGHNTNDSLRNYWTTTELIFSPFMADELLQSLSIIE